MAVHLPAFAPRDVTQKYPTPLLQQQLSPDSQQRRAGEQTQGNNDKMEK